ncbi:MAG: ABC transporter substrate-binding protein [Candidatus Saliniplasma sp.]
MLSKKKRLLSIVVTVILVASALSLTGCMEEDEDGEQEILLETTLYVPDDERADEMEVVQQQVRDAGIDLEIEAVEWGTYIEEVEAGNAPLSYSGWSGPTSPEGSLNYMKKGNSWDWYSGWYENDEFTEKLDDAVSETDDQARWTLYHEAQEILVDEDMGCFVMYTQRNPRAYHNSVDIPEESWNSFMGAGPLVRANEWEVEGSDRIEVAQTHEPGDFHPIRYTDVYSGYVFLQMFEPLVSTYPDGEVNTNEYTVAESFDISSDGLTMTFDIKDGIEFHNGDELNAHDVEFSINTMMMNEEDDEYFEMYDVDENPDSPREGDFGKVDSVEATDDYTLEISMDEPDMELLQKEGIEYLNILPKNYIEENGWEVFEDELIGSGPYELEHYDPGDEILLTEFEDYRNEVNTPEIRFDFYDEESTAVTALRSGDAHYMSRISPDNYYDLEDEDDVETRSYPYMGHNRIAFNHNDGPFTDPDVRKAFAYAIDVDEIIAVSQGDELADNTRSPIPSNHPAHNSDLNQYERDVDQAIELLEGAGYNGE